MNVIFLILFAALLLYGINQVLRKAPRYGPGFLLRVGAIAAVILIVLLALSGRLHWLIGLAAGLLPFVKRLLPMLLPLLRYLAPSLVRAGQQHRNRQRSQGQQSEVSTQRLRMTLDHDSGTMEGEILDGPLRGQRLHQLSIEQLAEFYRQCQSLDPDAIKLLDSYIQRHCREEWQAHHQGQEQSHQDAEDGQQELSINEAWEVLGLSPGADREAIIQAHKRMMARFHPDKGGSNYIARKINLAKEILLKHCNG